MDIKF
ncbi:hypothetical protein F383_34153 [Gossypium arboreum]